jgi:hypothetical protein
MLRDIHGWAKSFHPHLMDALGLAIDQRLLIRQNLLERSIAAKSFAGVRRWVGQNGTA